VESNFTSSAEKLKLPTRVGSRKLKMSESIASSIGSNLNKICGAQDLTKMLLTDDYFSDVNPRSMRRLLNIIYVTGEYFSFLCALMCALGFSPGDISYNLTS